MALLFDYFAMWYWIQWASSQSTGKISEFVIRAVMHFPDVHGFRNCTAYAVSVLVQNIT